jgi:hypothetical protein
MRKQKAKPKFTIEEVEGGFFKIVQSAGTSRARPVPYRFSDKTDAHKWIKEESADWRQKRRSQSK